MAIKIVVSDKVGFKVKGSINNESGVAEPFEFSVTATRLDTEAIEQAVRFDTGGGLIDFLVGVMTDWKGVKDEEGVPVPYSDEALRQLCKIPGLAGVVFQAYFAEVGAKAKN